MTIFGAFLRYVRVVRGANRRDVAGATGVTVRVLSAIENGKRGPLTAAQNDRLADFLNLNEAERRQLHETAKASSRFVRIPDWATPQQVKAVHDFVATLSRSGPGHAVAFESQGRIGAP